MSGTTATIPCPECKGKGSVTCSACHGQGRQPSSSGQHRPCPSCHGKGTSVCPLCKGARKVGGEK